MAISDYWWPSCQAGLFGSVGRALAVKAKGHRIESCKSPLFSYQLAKSCGEIIDYFA